jgi:hypothetical protein
VAAGLTLQLALIVLIPLLIAGIAAKSNIGPWAIFLAVLAAAGLYLLVRTSSR